MTYGYETDAEPQPKHGDHGTCAACGQEIEYRVGLIRNGLDTDMQDARWIHVVKPVDGHIAVLGGPA